jgi:hypothetical protein
MADRRVESTPFTPYKIVRMIQAPKPAIIIKTKTAIDATVKAWSDRSQGRIAKPPFAKSSRRE